jgi:UDP-N-acetylglucosamine transferase subunit ALG13
MSVFVTVGNAEQPFDRLIRPLDRYVAEGVLPEDTLMQIGSCVYEPRHAEFRRYLDGAAFAERIRDAGAVIAGAGAGTILQCLRAGKRPIVFPRLARFGEVVDDHQTEICSAFERKGFVYRAKEVTDIPGLLCRAMDASELPSFPPSQLPALVQDWLDGVARSRRGRT